MKPKIVIVGISGESVFLKTDHFHRFGETITVSEKYTEPGGKGYNQAVASAIFGADVTFLTIVGNDYYGEYAIDYLKDKGVNVKYRIVSDKQTSYATILTDKNGNNQVSVFAGSANSLTKEDVLLIENEIKNADYVLLQLEVSNEIISKVLEITKKYEVKVALNPAPSNLPSNHPFYHMVDILTPNEIEVRDIFDIPQEIDVTMYGEYLKDKIKNILVVTLGDKGCLLVKPNYYKYFTANKVDVVDTTGAGDIFNAALITKLSLGDDLESAIEFAIKVSSLSVTKPYVMNAILYLKEILGL